MIPQKLVTVQVLVYLVILTQIISSSVAAASSSKSKSSKSTKSKSSSSQRQRSGHQYAPPSLLLRPSKPDPHFEILDEQRGINYQSRLREGRDGSTERKPTKLKEATTTSLQRRSSSAITNSGSSYSKKGKKEKARPKASSSSSSSIESTFSKKSIEVVERTPPKFSGSQLISGEAGPLTHYSRRTELVVRDGWKILTGPSVSPDETALHVNENKAGNRRTFTSLTDDGASKHRTITKLRPMKKGKSIAGSSASRYYDMTNEISPIKQMLTEAERDFPASNRKTASRRTMQVSIPKQTLKHKYATITKRAPSKTAVMRSEAISETTEKKARKPQQNNNPKLLRPSKKIKSSLEARYASIENDINRMSPVMTLDTKKLVIQPIGSSAQPATLTTAPSMSMEVFSGEQEPTVPSLPMFSSLESRFDPIPLPMGDSTEVVDGNHGGHDSYFQTKTALSSAEYPLISVSASMNYPGSKRHKEQGGIITGSSFSNQHHHVDESEHRFLDFSPSHLAEVQEPAFRNPFLEETENFQHFSPISPHVEFVGAGTAGSKIPAPSSLHGPVGASRLSLTNGRLNSKLPPFRNRFPLELPPSPNFHFHGSVVPSENSFVTAGRYPHFSVGSRQPPPGLHDSLPRPPPEPVSSNIHPVLHGPPPPPFAAHGHRIPAHRPMPPPPPLYHHSHRHPPPPMALGSMRRPQFAPMELGSGRKAAAPPGDFVFEIGSLPPAHNPPPPPGVDPDHPAVQHALRNPHTILNDGIYIEPTDSSSNIQETTKKYLHNLHYQVHQNTLIPLDKRLVYLSMIFSWMFWITTFYTYYRWHITGNKAKQIVLNVPKDGDTPQVTTRSLDTSSPWNFTKVLEYIEIAQKTYEGFDWQDLECQKRTLCELVQKQNEPWGETGRKLANSYVYQFMDALDGVPIPQMIQTYLRQYKEAVSQGKNSSKDCGQVYSKCKFSIKEVLNKATAKKRA